MRGVSHRRRMARASALVRACDTASSQNLHTANPVVEIGDAVYDAHYEDTLGTCMLFDKATAALVAKTAKKLVCVRRDPPLRPRPSPPAVAAEAPAEPPAGAPRSVSQPSAAPADALTG
jgi:hypothetical protein